MSGAGRVRRLAAALYALLRPPVPRTRAEWDALSGFYQGLTI